MTEDPRASAAGPQDPTEHITHIVLAMLDWFSLLLGLPAMAGLLLVELLAEGPTGWALGYAVAASLMGVLLLGRRALGSTARARLYAAMLLSISIASAGLVGPVLTVGAIMSSVLVAVGLLLGPVDMVAVVVVLEVAVVVATVLSPGSPDHAAWVRAAVLLPLVFVPQGLLVLDMRRRMQAAHAAAVAALERERELHASELRVAAELERVHRTEALGRLAGGVAHDVNNALAVIVGNTGVLRDDPSLGAEAREMTDDILQAAGSAREVIGQLMLLGQPKGDGISCRPGEVVTAMARSLERLLPESLRLEVTVDSDAWVELERSALERVLLNLALNARDAMEGAGTLAMHVSEDEVSVTLRVWDTGPGMDAEVAERAFDPFYTTKAAGMGTGLGLAAVHGLVTSAGGCIRLDASPGEGAAFTMSFPRIQGPVSTPAPAPERAETPSLRVLVAEDERMVRASLERLLRRLGHTVHSVEDGPAALTVLADDQGFDLLLTDAVMPHTDTPALIGRFREACPDAAVIVCSGWVQAPELQNMIDAGDVAYLPKPFGGEELRGAVEASLS